MSSIDKEFLNQTKNILKNGETYTNVRRGVTRLEVPKIDFTHSFENGFPALSLKKLEFNDVVGELIWFLRGDNNTRYLYENNIKIWDKDALNYFNKVNGVNIDLKRFREQVKYYSVGRNYSKQWRNFNGYVDQIKNLIDGMIKDINGSRNRVESWNASELDKTALPPCHTGFQCVGTSKGFWLSFNMRAWDWFLGASFNIASYAILGKILELITGHKCLGIMPTGHCVHLYENQIEPARELLKRDPDKHQNCELEISDKVKELCKNYDGDVDKIFNYMNIEDFALKNYTCDEKMRVSMIAPKSI